MRWLFDLEVWLWKQAEPLAFGGRRRRGWHIARLMVSRMTRRIEDRGRLL